MDFLTNSYHSAEKKQISSNHQRSLSSDGLSNYNKSQNIIIDGLSVDEYSLKNYGKNFKVMIPQYQSKGKFLAKKHQAKNSMDSRKEITKLTRDSMLTTHT